MTIPKRQRPVFLNFFTRPDASMIGEAVRMCVHPWAIKWRGTTYSAASDGHSIVMLPGGDKHEKAPPTGTRGWLHCITPPPRCKWQTIDAANLQKWAGKSPTVKAMKTATATDWCGEHRDGRIGGLYVDRYRVAAHAKYFSGVVKYHVDYHRQSVTLQSDGQWHCLMAMNDHANQSLEVFTAGVAR